MSPITCMQNGVNIPTDILDITSHGNYMENVWVELYGQVKSTEQPLYTKCLCIPYLSSCFLLPLTDCQVYHMTDYQISDQYFLYHCSLLRAHMQTGNVVLSQNETINYVWSCCMAKFIASLDYCHIGMEFLSISLGHLGTV